MANDEEAIAEPGDPDPKQLGNDRPINVPTGPSAALTPDQERLLAFTEWVFRGFPRGSVDLSGLSHRDIVDAYIADHPEETPPFNVLTEACGMCGNGFDEDDEVHLGREKEIYHDHCCPDCKEG